jgi:hypothetical protein
MPTPAISPRSISSLATIVYFYPVLRSQSQWRMEPTSLKRPLDTHLHTNCLPFRMVSWMQIITRSSGHFSKTEKARRLHSQSATKTGEDAIQNSMLPSKLPMAKTSKDQEELCCKEQRMVSNAGVQTRIIWSTQSTGPSETSNMLSSENGLSKTRLLTSTPCTSQMRPPLASNFHHLSTLKT